MAFLRSIRSIASLQFPFRFRRAGRGEAGIGALERALVVNI